MLTQRLAVGQHLPCRVAGGAEIDLIEQRRLVDERQNPRLPAQLGGQPILPTDGVHSVHVVIVGHCQSVLLEVVLALRAARRFPRLLHGGKQQGNQNRDDRNHHQQFDQRKRPPSP